MASTDYAALMRQAEEAGFSSSVIPDGPGYELVIAKANAKQTQGNPPKDQIGMFIKVTSGPLAGTSTWANQTITPDNPDAMRIFFSEMAKFGLDKDFFSQPGLTADTIAGALEGRKFTADVGHRVWGKAKDRVDNTFKNVRLTSDLPSPPAQAPPVIPAPQPQPQPQPAAAPLNGVSTPSF